MLSTVIIILLALILLAYVAVPLLFQSQVDELPDLRDPILQDLREERDALFRAIRELELRDDLALERREQLRARYEAKAAKVLRAIDDRQAQTKGQAPAKPAPRTRRVPYGALSLLGIAVVTATVMSGHILPRVGEDATVTTTNLEAARELRDLQRAAERSPTVDNLLALGDAYWQLNDAEGAEETYYQFSQEISPVPPIVYQRLGFLTLQEDIGKAAEYFELARDSDPTNLDTLYTLSEIYFSQARPDDAVASLETFLAQPGGAGDTEVKRRLETFRAVAPVLNAATADPNEANLLALGDVYWQVEERERAAEIYTRVLSTFNPHNALALSRIGQLLFFTGRNEEAVEILERSREVNADNLGTEDLDTLLFLGNAYFTLEQFDEAVMTWETYVEVAGGEAQAGRVPSLIESAKARLADASTRPDADAVGAEAAAPDPTSAEAEANDAEVQQISAQGLYAANCATCHGAVGQGGSGPMLANNRNAAREANVRNLIQYGRGTMPGYGAVLSEGELDALTAYVVEVIAVGEASR